MDKRQTIAHLAQDKEEAMLLALLCERMEAAERKNIAYFSPFLTGREQMLAQKLLADTACTFFGGYAGAERQILCYLPDYMDADFLSSDASPICAVRAAFFEKDRLSHRDVLGALMGAGIKRGCVGDIFVTEGACEFLLLREMLEFVVENFTSAGRTRLHAEEIPLCKLQVPQANVKTLRDTVPSLRLDCVISAGFSISRGKAAEYIAQGRAELDHAPCTKCDKLTEQGAVISVRGVGKMRLKSVDGTTKKGRIGVTVERYL